MSSSVLYAYLRSMEPPHNAFTPLYVPVTNIPAEDIQLRPEYLAIFRHANIDPGHLITLDDLPNMSVIQSKLRPENTKWILVDHNTLQGQLGNIYSHRVAGVIDHHEDEGKIPQDTAPEPRIIEKSGSCTSLVTEYCRQAWDLASLSARESGAANAQSDGNLSDDDTVTKLWDAQVAQLGLASILIDTNNLQSKEKTTKHDKQAVKYLEAKIMECPQLSLGYDRARFFAEIETAKKDIGAMPLHGILRKDYKQWDEGGQRLGISSVVKPIDFLIKKAGDEAATSDSPEEAFFKELRSFSQERGLGMYAIMTTFSSPSGKHQRELLVWSFNEPSMSAAKKFATDSSETLGLEAWQADNSIQHHNEGEWLKVWRQGNVRQSRKQVAPLLRQAMI